jgi:hypothetical protein
LHRFANLILAGLLAWQAAAAVVALGRGTVAGAAVGYQQRLCAGTAARISGAIGDDVEVYQVLRTHVPAGAIVLTLKVHGPIADLQSVVAASRRLLQLTQLLYPDPYLCPVNDPIRVAENAAAGTEPWLLVLPGDVAPIGRAGWTCDHRSERCQLWRFRKV